MLEGEGARDALVGVPAAHPAARARGKIRVRPGDADGSFLWQKVSGPAPDEGDKMPFVGHDLGPVELWAIRDWIVRGAKP